MCSVDSFEDGASYMKEKKKINILDAVCRKCSTARAVIVLQTKFPYCRECFIQVVTHKFFGTLGKSKLLKPGDRLLVAFSGSASSATLLQLIWEGLHKRRKKVASEVYVAFIDEGDFLGLAKDERIEILKELKGHLDKYGFTNFFVVSSPKEPEVIAMEDQNFVSDVEKLYEKISTNTGVPNGVVSSTSQQDFLVKIRQNLIVKIAKKLDCQKIFTAETSNHMAVKILSNLAIGRGGQLPLDVGFRDDRDDVVILRPMVEWSRKEVAFYNVFNNINLVSLPKASRENTPSIQELTEKFVTNLQEYFPATMSTIVGTGSKLKVKTENDVEDDYCILCKSKLDTVHEESSALSAYKISHLVSTLGPKGLNTRTFTPAGTVVKNTTNCEETSSDNCSNCCCKGRELKVMDLREFLCHGCQLILGDSASLENWPADVLLRAQQRGQLKQMSKEIESFLLK